MVKLQELWCGFRRDEQIVLIVCTLALIFCGGINYSRWRSSKPPAPVFKEAPDLPAKKSSRNRDPSSNTARTLIHVSGAVRRPGVLALPVGARVIDAIHGAGGATTNGDIHVLNLAARLQDGQHLVVPPRQTQTHAMSTVASAAAPPSAQVSPVRRRASTAPTRAPLGVINVNTATATELEALPGIGPTLASRIVQYREQKGPFHSLEDLDQVKGLGPKKLEKLRKNVSF